MGVNIFALLMLLLSLSDWAVDMGCDAPPVVAQECWIVTPDGIGYEAMER